MKKHKKYDVHVVFQLTLHVLERLSVIVQLDYLAFVFTLQLRCIALKNIFG